MNWWNITLGIFLVIAVLGVIFTPVSRYIEWREKRRRKV